MVGFADDGKPLRVRYPMSEAIWNKVVVDSQVEHSIEREDAQDFIVEYPSREIFEQECVRFEGMVEYHELPAEN